MQPVATLCYSFAMWRNIPPIYFPYSLHVLLLTNVFPVDVGPSLLPILLSLYCTNSLTRRYRSCKIDIARLCLVDTCMSKMAMLLFIAYWQDTIDLNKGLIIFYWQHPCVKNNCTYHSMSWPKDCKLFFHTKKYIYLAPFLDSAQENLPLT